MSAFTKVPEDTFENLQMNAGILVNSFNPATPSMIGELLGATTGGFSFNSNPSYSDFGEDVDNMPANTKEMKHLDGYDPTISGTFLTVTADTVKSLIAAADVGDHLSVEGIKITPREKLTDEDFTDLWWIGDYSDINTGAKAGFLAVHLINALNTAGLQITTSKNAKGQFAFEYHGHYSIDDISTPPFEVFVYHGEAA